MTPPDQERISKSTLKDLPKGARIEFQDEALLIKIGTEQHNKVGLARNALKGIGLMLLTIFRQIIKN